MKGKNFFNIYFLQKNVKEEEFYFFLSLFDLFTFNEFSQGLKKLPIYYILIVIRYYNYLFY